VISGQLKHFRTPSNITAKASGIATGITQQVSTDVSVNLINPNNISSTIIHSGTNNNPYLLKNLVAYNSRNQNPLSFSSISQSKINYLSPPSIY
jgi:hypothetical protein